jgi:two-component system sensor histidine kinase KdpD
MAHGTLRIYIGAAPGVGKTFAMLNEGWRRSERGTDVVVGFVETHGRALTAAQLRDLAVIPRQVIEYRGQQFEEMDLRAVLARQPKVALVDELAHTNVPGCRNAKRWEDIAELLAAGIDVISTVNIQHLESINDVVEQITGVVQRETVPDAVVRAAEQIELVDMTPEALRRRMAHGNIYAAEKVDAALSHYFRVGNLAALRELALLWVADRVDESLEEYRERHDITEPWETRERVVVALTGAVGGERLIRRGARMAARTHAELVGVHVRDADGLAGDHGGDLERHRTLLNELGGRFAEVAGADPADALVRFARSENATQILLGSSHRSRWAELTRGSVVNRVIRAAGSIDVHVISADEVSARGATRRERATRSPTWRSPRSRTIAWLCAFLGIPLAALALIPLRDTMGVPGTLLLLMVGPVAVAALGGLAPALSASIVAFLCADWLYITPIHSFRFAHAGDALALVVFVGVSSFVSVLVDRLARRSVQLARGQAEIEALAELASGTATLDEDAQHRLVVELRRTLDFESAAVLTPTIDGWQNFASAGDPVPPTPDDASFSAELVNGSMLTVSGRALTAEDRRVLGAFVAQLRLVQTALRLQTEAASAAALADANKVRDALLAAVSHDLRTPLANIKAAATSLLSADVGWSASDVRSFSKTIDVEADRLHSVVSNLLDMSRLQAGMLGVRMDSVSVDAAVYTALAGLSVDMTAVDVRVPDCLYAKGDSALLERALANIIGNALDWAPDGTTVRVEAAELGDHVDIRVVDRGAGIPRDQREAVFRPFQRLGDGARANYDGIGLGLAVTKGFVEAMDGRVTIDDTPGGGTTVVVTLDAPR